METVDSLRNIISYKEAISSSLLIIKNVVRFRSDRQIAELMDSYHGGVAHKIAQIDLEIRMNGAFENVEANACLLYTSPSPRDGLLSRMPSSA